METYSLRGRVHMIWDLDQFSDKFRKREFVVESKATNDRGTFVDYIKMQLTQANCDLLEGVHVGDHVAVRWTLAGRKWGKKGEEKYFTNVEALEITVVSRADRSETVSDEMDLPLDDDPFANPITAGNESVNNDLLDIPDDLPF